MAGRRCAVLITDIGTRTHPYHQREFSVAFPAIGHGQIAPCWWVMDILHRIMMIGHLLRWSTAACRAVLLSLAAAGAAAAPTSDLPPPPAADAQPAPAVAVPRPASPPPPLPVQPPDPAPQPPEPVAAAPDPTPPPTTTESPTVPEPVQFAPVVVIETPASVNVDAAWFDQPLGLDPQAWRFSAALAAMGASAQADALRRVLLQRHLAQVAGEVTDPALTVGLALVQGQSLPMPDTDAGLRARWAETINRHLQARPPTAALPIPPELEVDAARLREAAPGLWSLHAPDGAVRGRVWWLQLHNAAALPLALAEFRVRAPAGPLNTVFDCSLPRYAEMLLALPGRDTAYLCRANAGAGSERAFAELARQLRSNATLPLRLEPVDLSSPIPVRRVAQRLEAAHKAAADALVVTVSVAWQSAAAPPRAAADKGAATRQPSSQAVDRWKIGGLCALALALYSALAWLAGRRAALLTSWLALTALSLTAAFKGLPGLWSALPRVDTWSVGAAVLPPMMILAAVVLPFVATLVLSVAHELLFGERIGVLRALGRAVAAALAEGVIERLFGRRRA